MSNAVTTRADAARGVSLVPLFEKDRVRAALTPFLSDGITYERMVAAVQMAAAKNPAIARCTTVSIITAVGQALRSGLEIGETAHLVPFGTELTFIADYKGIAQLLVASGGVRHVELRVVREGDDFAYEYGLDARLMHRPSSGSEAPITHAYVVFRLPFNASAFEVMAADEIDAIRKKYSKQWKTGGLLGWYAKKTVLRQAAKTLPKSEKLMRALRAIQTDAESEFGETVSEPMLHAVSDDEIPLMPPESPLADPAARYTARIERLLTDPVCAGIATEIRAQLAAGLTMAQLAQTAQLLQERVQQAEHAPDAEPGDRPEPEEERDDLPF